MSTGIPYVCDIPSNVKKKKKFKKQKYLYIYLRISKCDKNKLVCLRIKK